MNKFLLFLRLGKQQLIMTYLTDSSVCTVSFSTVKLLPQVSAFSLGPQKTEYMYFGGSVCPPQENLLIGPYMYIPESEYCYFGFQVNANHISQERSEDFGYYGPIKYVKSNLILLEVTNKKTESFLNYLQVNKQLLHELSHIFSMVPTTRI